MADASARLDVLEDWRDSTVDPALSSMGARMTATESTLNQAQGSFRVIKWLLYVNTGLLGGLLTLLGGWGLQHITFKVEASPAPLSSVQPAQNAYSTPQYITKR